MSKGTVNKMVILGRLGKDPELKYTASGNSIANLSIATTESYKDKQTGQANETTEWHRVVFFGKLAEAIGQYCAKGSQLYVEGRLRTNKWQDKQGQDRYTTETVGREFQFIGGNKDEHKQTNKNVSQNSGDNSYAQAKGKPLQRQLNNDFNDDLPF
jgi:single-strand DNA-binding protein